MASVGASLLGVGWAVCFSTEPSVSGHLFEAKANTELWLSSQTFQQDKKLKQILAFYSVLQTSPEHDRGETKGQSRGVQKGVKQNYPI